MDRKEAYVLASILCLAILMRMVGSNLNKVLVFDGWLYCSQAYLLAFEGRLPTIFPLSPMLMAAFVKTLGHAKWSYLAVPIASGALATALTYILASRYIARDLSLTIALLTAFNPILIWSSSHAMTEPLLILLLISAFLAFLKRSFLASGFLTGFAYLCRYPAVILVALISGKLALERRRKEASLYLTGFFTVAALWQVLSIYVGAMPFHTEYYSIFQTLGGLPKLSLEALGPMLIKIFIGLALTLSPLIPLAPYLKFKNRDLLLPLTVLWLIPHLGYYLLQSFDTYAHTGQVVASERVARWSSPIFPFASTLLLNRSGRWFKLSLTASLALSIALSLYLINYTNVHGAIKETWDSFLGGSS